MSKEIDYSPATHELNQVLFDAKLQPVYSNFKFPNELFKRDIEAPQYKAVVNQDNGRVISIVGNSYQLITNKEALEMGKDVFTQIYPGYRKDEFIPYKIIAPKSLASVHIDLIHKNVNFKVWDQEEWLPFLRVTNSYNRSHALSFEVGFVRELCSNGVLFNKDTMKLKYYHNRHNQFLIKNDVGEIMNMKEQFTELCNRAFEVEIPRELLFPMVCSTLKVNLNVSNSKQKTRKINQLNRLNDAIVDIQTNYKYGDGYNAYSVFNIATDIVSHHDEYRIFPGYYFSLRTFFARPSDWLSDITGKSLRNDFSLDGYIQTTVEGLKELSKETNFKWN